MSATVASPLWSIGTIADDADIAFYVALSSGIEVCQQMEVQDYQRQRHTLFTTEARGTLLGVFNVIWQNIKRISICKRTIAALIQCNANPCIKRTSPYF